MLLYVLEFRCNTQRS